MISKTSLIVILLCICAVCFFCGSPHDPMQTENEPEPIDLADCKIAFTSNAKGLYINSNILIVNGDGTDMIDLTALTGVQPNHMGFFHIMWSSDGNMIAFDVDSGPFDEREIWIANLKGHYMQRIGRRWINVSAEILTNVLNYNPSWFYDNTKMIFNKYHSNTFTNQLYSQIYEVDLQGILGDEKRITKDDVYDEHPTYSPNGRYIACASKCQALYNMPIFDLYLYELPSLRRTILFDCDARFIIPVWSPDGTKIVAMTSEHDNKYMLYVLDVYGRNIVNITEQVGYGWYPSWSPDGSKIAFTYVDKIVNYREIYTIRPDGTGLTQLTYNESDDYQPTWSPDGRYIAFSTNRNGNYEIFVMKSDGTEQTKVAGIDGINCREPVFSPVGY